MLLIIAQHTGSSPHTTKNYLTQRAIGQAGEAGVGGKVSHLVLVFSFPRGEQDSLSSTTQVLLGQQLPPTRTRPPKKTEFITIINNNHHKSGVYAARGGVQTALCLTSQATKRKAAPTSTGNHRLGKSGRAWNLSSGPKHTEQRPGMLLRSLRAPALAGTVLQRRSRGAPGAPVC